MAKESENRELQPGERVQNYIIERRASAGGHGSLYKARHATLDGNVVAIKVLHSVLGENAELVTRMEREGKILSSLQHDNIVKVIDAGTHGVLPYIIMEWLKGRTLEQVLVGVRHRGVGLQPALEIGTEVADALDHAHAKGVVHRDVKPANIFLQFAPGRPNHTLTKLLDFGVARIVGTPKITRENFIVGTALYASPEQARGEDPTPKSDHYAFGLLLYEMLVGRHPFEHRVRGNNIYPVLEAHLSEKPTPFSAAENVPRPVAELIMSCLEKQAHFRPASMLEIARVLREFNAKVEAQLAHDLASLSKTDPTPVQNAVTQGGNEVTDPGPPPDNAADGGRTAPDAPAAMRNHENSNVPVNETRHEARAFAGNTLRMAVNDAAPTVVPPTQTPINRSAVTHSAKPLLPIRPRTGTEPSGAPRPIAADSRFRAVGDRVVFVEDEAPSASPRPNSAFLAPTMNTTGRAGAVSSSAPDAGPIPAPPGVRRAGAWLVAGMVVLGLAVVSSLVIALGGHRSRTSDALWQSTAATTAIPPPRSDPTIEASKTPSALPPVRAPEATTAISTSATSTASIATPSAGPSPRLLSPASAAGASHRSRPRPAPSAPPSKDDLGEFRTTL
jgi:serine/threonine protein kinase